MEKKIIKALAIFSAIVTIALVLVIFFASKRIGRLQDIENIYEIAKDSLVVIVNKYDQEVAKSEVLQTENTTLFTQLKIKDKDIIRLQQVIINYEKENKKVNTALIISNETNIKLQDSITALIIGYSHDINTPEIIYPIYKRTFDKKWYSGSVIIGLDTLDINILSRNAYDIIIGDEKAGLFRRRLYANITNLNPDTETKVMKVYQKQEVKNTNLRNAGIFTGIGIIIGLLIN
jgi:hypothetical protein